MKTLHNPVIFRTTILDKMKVNMTFKELLLMRMIKMNLKPSQLERKAGLSPSSIKKMLESDNPNPTLKTLISISKVLNCDLNYFMEKNK